MLRMEKVSKSCDVYSYGVLLFEIATQQLPFPDVLPIMVPAMIAQGKVGSSIPKVPFTLGECPYILVHQHVSFVDPWREFTMHLNCTLFP